MFKDRFFDEISAKWASMIENSPIKDFEKNLKAVMLSLFDKMDLVTREEFDIQQEVLLRTREKLTLLERKVTELEKLAKIELSSHDEVPL